MKDSESIDDFSMKLTTIVTNIHSLGDKVEEIYVIKKFLRVVPLRFMQIVMSIEQFDDLKNMSVEEIVGCFMVHEAKLRDYDEEWLTRTKRKDAANSSCSGTKRHDGQKRSVKVVGVIVNVVAEEVVTISHKSMIMPTPRRTRVWLSVMLV